jgi:hypothetical protein
MDSDSYYKYQLQYKKEQNKHYINHFCDYSNLNKNLIKNTIYYFNSFDEFINKFNKFEKIKYISNIHFNKSNLIQFFIKNRKYIKNFILQQYSINKSYFNNIFEFLQKFIYKCNLNTNEETITNLLFIKKYKLNNEESILAYNLSLWIFEEVFLSYQKYTQIMKD